MVNKLVFILYTPEGVEPLLANVYAKQQEYLLRAIGGAVSKVVRLPVLKDEMQLRNFFE